MFGSHRYEEFYARDSIRSATGSYSAWAADRLLTVFKMFDEDGDKQLNLREFRHFLLKTGTRSHLLAMLIRPCQPHIRFAQAPWTSLIWCVAANPSSEPVWSRNLIPAARAT